MSYKYEIEKSKLFTEDGVKHLREVEQQADKLIETAGAFLEHKISVLGDSWLTLAALDYLCEQGKIIKAERVGMGSQQHWGQYQIYADPQVTNR